MVYGAASLVVLLGIGALLAVGLMLISVGMRKDASGAGSAPSAGTCAGCGERLRKGAEFCARCGRHA